MSTLVAAPLRGDEELVGVAIALPSLTRLLPLLGAMRNVCFLIFWTGRRCVAAPLRGDEEPRRNVTRSPVRASCCPS